MRKTENQIREERPKIDCAHTQCPYPGDVDLKLKTGWAHLCKSHYEFHIQQQADDFCKANDLTTRAAQLAFIREKLHSSKLLRHVREPGEEG
jgi:hypothetical protein